MPTLSIKSSGGDATSLSGAEALISDNSSAWILQYQENFADTTVATINASIAGGGSIAINVQAGFKHNGTFGSGARFAYAGAGGGLNIEESCSVSDLEVHHTNAAGDYAILTSGGSGKTITCKRLLVRMVSTASGATACWGWNSATYNIYNCALVVNTSAFAGTVNGIQKFSGTGNCYNCTVIINANAASQGSSFKACNVQNCIGVKGSSGDAAAGWFEGCTALGNGYNLQTYDLAAPGANEWHNVAGATILANVTAGSEDARWLNYATMISYTGADASGTIGDSLSLENNTRLATWYIGAGYSYPAAPTVDATPAPDASYTVGDAFSVDHAFTGTGSGTWDVSAGAVPSGTSIAGATGIVSGTLTTVEAVSYTARVTDAWSQTGSRAFTTTVNAPAVAAPSGHHFGSLGLGLGL